jgi:non-heme chloroperoxidase
LFRDAGYAPLAPGWPDDPETVEEANENPEVFAHKTIGQIADHVENVIAKLHRAARRHRAFLRWVAGPGPGR